MEKDRKDKGRVHIPVKLHDLSDLNCTYIYRWM